MIPSNRKKPTRTRPSNDPGSFWYSTPNSARKRPAVVFTITPEAREALTRMAAVDDRSRSQIVNDLILEALAKRSLQPLDP